ncbi:polyphosphate kinase 2 [Methylovirgula ligni]|jgi:PPK2 family polyphosphate:nucleotide phosphotransferase|uniref:Polyphosphate:AMP phosphotransferase n=1 Tax=Methylovirgula ligni TaxID=569860 RepID=A0A3D9YZ81_9HYPH|nr:polyphosphate kinase 2 family protein [Methylovirgula ligni]QAY96878.1 polyphosphate kinase 2 [Methylovirgula ligni]REF88074.1 polyphosphate:AMP phosphotransferase [Methylovirgula ligni]
MDYRKKFIVPPGKKLRLADTDPADTRDQKSEADSADLIERYRQKLADMQTLLYAEGKRALLIVLQAMDAGGKDGTISHVMRAMNPQGVSVSRFEAPTPEEQAHDFLWRVHMRVPRRSQVGVFNRSHYEDVLITRVHKEIDADTCKARYEQIRDFEAELFDSGTHILKFFLHISEEEQLARFAQRLEDPHRNWKISEADYTERAFWDDYMDAYQDALSATSTRDAPWFVIPSNHKWFRNLAISQIVGDTLEDLGMKYPKPHVDLDKIRHDYHAAVAEADGKKKRKG